MTHHYSLAVAESRQQESLTNDSRELEENYSLQDTEDEMR